MGIARDRRKARHGRRIGVAADQIKLPRRPIAGRNQSVEAVFGQQPVDALRPREAERLGARLAVGAVIQPMLGLRRLKQVLAKETIRSASVLTFTAGAAAAR